MRFAFLLALTMLAACDSPKPQSPADTWERSLQCSAQADHLAQQYGWDKIIAGWKSHYNAQRQRCFVLKIDGGSGEELYDAAGKISLGSAKGTGSFLRECESNFDHPFTEDPKTVDCGEFRALLQDLLEK